MKKYSFSLIELLVVIAVIAILMGILIPVFSGMGDNAKIHQARQEMQGIVTAIKAYENTYGILPNLGIADTDGKAEKIDTSEETAYHALMEVLTCVPTNANTSGTHYNNSNTRQTRFLEVPSDYTTKGYLDPWGNRYIILLDVNYDKKINDQDTGASEGGIVDGNNDGTVKDNSTEDVLYGTVYAYSLGPANKTSPGKGTNYDDDGYLWDNKKGDVNTWKTTR